ncbi:hypothetical protein RFI_10582 [Reticulomyxa filosa]|uniref:Uncharacterized protein n=1 Tax=Reticulomyxa filosa TaxID=46433 RepID=X6NLG8_RETFI|nr:hypothetical protein RFI_10582 [Reticulomyxa filosa]|eukprot:ETO26559.1 hypothetical protein RFI_10582 [Reticulomyxa filosa]
MARNQEKAQTMLARWLRYKEEEAKGPKEQRPYLAELCNDLHKAEKWRGQIIKEISKNVSEIQNASLGEHRIRDLNDRINKLLREKRHWERRIKELVLHCAQKKKKKGGMDYTMKRGGKGIESMSISGRGGYLYFGAARDLPGVRELLQVNEEEITTNSGLRRGGYRDSRKRSRKDMYDIINADYYGFGDDDDGEIIWREKQQEMKGRWIPFFNKKIIIKPLRKYCCNLMKEWRRQNSNVTPFGFAVMPNDDQNKLEWKEGNDERPWQQPSAGSQQKKRKRVNPITMKGIIPTQEEVNAAILEKRKQLMLAKYLNMHIHEDKTATDKPVPS